MRGAGAREIRCIDFHYACRNDKSLNEGISF